MAYFVVKSDPS